MHGGSEPAFLPGPASPGELEKEAIPEGRLPRGQGPSKGGLILFSEGAKGGMTSEKQKQPLVLGKQRVLRHGDGRGALRPEVSVGNKTRQMTIARSTFDKNGRLAQGAVFIPKGKVASYDRLNTRTSGGLVELQEGEEIIVISQPHRRHTQSFAPGHQRLHPDQPVDEAVLRVHAKMDEGRGGHDGFGSFPGVKAAIHRRTGLKLRRWAGVGPRASRAARCSGTG